MINPIELKINNWVEHNGKYKQIAMIESNGKSEHFVRFKNELSSSKTPCNDINPIVPNVEIISQVNHLIIPTDTDMNISTLEIISNTTFKIVAQNSLDIYYDYKYAHQLQNAYFALTTKELPLILS